jgi:DNA-binding TFAR19-related protein (PDSD5 family)
VSEELFEKELESLSRNVELDDSDEEGREGLREEEEEQGSAPGSEKPIQHLDQPQPQPQPQPQQPQPQPQQPQPQPQQPEPEPAPQRRKKTDAKGAAPAGPPPAEAEHSVSEEERASLAILKDLLEAQAKVRVARTRPLSTRSARSSQSSLAQLPKLGAFVDKMSPSLFKGWQRRFLLVSDFNLFYCKVAFAAEDLEAGNKEGDEIHRLPLVRGAGSDAPGFWRATRLSADLAMGVCRWS